MKGLPGPAQRLRPQLEGILLGNVAREPEGTPANHYSGERTHPEKPPGWPGLDVSYIDT